MAYSYHKLKIYEKAIENYNKAIEIESTLLSDKYDSYLALAEIYNELGQYDKMNEYQEKAKSLGYTED